jgi:hypothetical protein
VDPATDTESVDNAPSGSAPSIGSNRSGGPSLGAGTDNRTATKPGPDAGATPNFRDSNRDAKPVKSGLKGQDNPKGPNDQTRTGPAKPSADSSNRGNRGRTPNVEPMLEPGENNAAPYGAAEDLDNGAASGVRGAGGSNGKQTPGRNNPGKGKRGGRAKFPPLTTLDESMEPQFDPAGMPALPSTCAERSDCLPCFDDATAAMDKQRVNLEKLRSIHQYTHRFTREGTEFLSAAGASGGGLAQLGAAAEVRKVNGALDSFDEKVRAKASELLGNLDASLQQMAQCEATYMDDDNWYAHHGQVYLQFMKGHYAF